MCGQEILHSCGDLEPFPGNIVRVRYLSMWGGVHIQQSGEFVGFISEIKSAHWDFWFKKHIFEQRVCTASNRIVTPSMLLGAILNEEV